MYRDDLIGEYLIRRVLAARLLFYIASSHAAPSPHASSRGRRDWAFIANRDISVASMRRC